MLTMAEFKIEDEPSFSFLAEFFAKSHAINHQFSDPKFEFCLGTYWLLTLKLSTSFGVQDNFVINFTSQNRIQCALGVNNSFMKMVLYGFYMDLPR